ncbi:EAL domain-containing response regulator [Microcoleus sp. FACHB-672]|uniref:EAL domain-containing response regulator n=1 Tax=Microcoleus sp. FACHB-672 TaxID=2692825 RepID=UPI0016890004|nr:EAL domain-containing response regulator [Microcoleus sp. FACHB-672]MBD2043446.1 EAL domain-containing protein [Microcoleus sp. FACHB-672]
MPKILVIEDEELIRENILELLELEAFEAIGAENGLIGFQRATEELPDLIICDVMMPEMDGHSVLNALRNDPSTATIPFIFLTARTDRLDVRAGMDLGADDYLTKPCTPDELLRAIATRLKKSAALQKQYDTQLNQASTRLNNLLYFDSLTKIPNRLSLQDRFNQNIAALAAKDPDKSPTKNLESLTLPILCVGLDRFSRINETLGYEFGDLLLKAVADRLTNRVSEGSIVARLNADQFAIILAPVEHKKAAAESVQILQHNLCRPFFINGREVFVTPSIGVAFYPRHGSELDKLLQYAKKAMDQVKQQGGNGCEFYTPAFPVGDSDQLALETELRYALEGEELALHYQPQVSLQTGKIVGCEALLRWHHPVRGSISPAKFIPLAEETGLIEPIGEWVLSTACRQTQAWQANGYESLRVAVNLSGRQFTQLNLRQRVVEILAQTNFNPEYLDLELTEGTLVQNPEVAIRQLDALKAIGVQIAIDDFGTGYSSLSYLRQFPFDILKIDRCFVSNLHKDAKNTAITTALIQLAHQLNLKVIAEGVETEAELAFLYQHQCDEIQGYYFSRPVPSSEFEKLLAGGNRLQLPQNSI